MSKPTLPPSRLFTAFGTVLFVDPSTGELRHGPVETSPANVFLEPATYGLDWHPIVGLTYAGDGAREPVVCNADSCLVVSAAQKQVRSARMTSFELMPLERGLLGLRAGGMFLSAIPDGTVHLKSTVCSTWELFISTETWPTKSLHSYSDGLWRTRGQSFNVQAIKSYIVHPIIRTKANRQADARKILIYGYTRWSHGRVYYDLCRHLHDRGYIVDILDWQVNHAAYWHDVLPYYDFVLSAPDGVSVLADTYRVPFEKMIVVSHSEFDLQMLIDAKGHAVFEQFANYGVVSEHMYCTSMMRGIQKMPMVTSLGVNFEEFYTEIPERLVTVGYASSMSARIFGMELKRGELAQASVEDAELAFKVAGSTGNQTSIHDMPAFYRSVDAVLISSVSEAGPLPVLEAAAAGRLIIGTPVGHFPQKAYQGGGILAPVEPEKYRKFTGETLRYFRDNPGAFLEKCHAIQSTARKFDWKYSIDDWVQLIERAGSA